MRVVIAGGGSGGHLFPGIAVAEEFMRRDASAEVVFIGNESGVEARVLPHEGYAVRLLKVEGVVGRSITDKVRGIWRALQAVRASLGLLDDLKPDIVVGTGGYVSVGPVTAAWIRRLPILLMEQNVAPGMATRVLARMADALAVTYHETLGQFPRANAHRTGNPVRASIMKGDRQRACEIFSLDPHRFTVLIAGGSQGARRINESVLGALEHLLTEREGIQFLHQTGEQDYERVRKTYRDLGFRAMAAPFVHQMAEAYALADMVVSRAGATTLAELTALGKPVLLVPYPHAAAHQEQNARTLIEVGGARMVRDADLTGEILAAEILGYYRSEELRGEMRRQSRSLGRPDAAARVVDLALSVVRKRKGQV